MHPEVRQEKPGMCPECGMQLVQVKNENLLSAQAGKMEHEGHAMHDKHKGHSTNIFKIKFWISLALTIPVVLIAWVFPDFAGASYISLALGSAVFFYGGWVFLIGGWREIRGKLPGMMTLISIAISAAYLWSIYAVFTANETLFWELTTLITIMLLGHWLEMRAVSGAQGALKELSKLLPDIAEVVWDGKIKTVQLSELHEGDVVLVKPGAKIPADGTVLEGESDVNESMVTGESNPVLKRKEDTVIAGTINGDGSLHVRVSHIGEKTFLAGIMRLIAEAQASKSRLQMLSDRAALYLTVLAVGGGLITLIAWLAAGADVSYAIARLVAVLVIACPHALGLAVPLVASISTTKAARNGFLVKQRLVLEAAKNVDTVLFDKTGTLTEGTFSITHVTSPETLMLAASVNAHSEHPIGKAIVEEARKGNLRLQPVTGFKRIPGKGAEGEINNRKIFVGHTGGNDIMVLSDGKEVGSISIADSVRPQSKEAVEELQKMGIKAGMITGDSEEAAKKVADELGLDTYFARVLPQEKSEKVRLLQKEGKRVAMVGDGINDAPALTQADVGIAVGAGTNVAIESAGIILIQNDPRDIVKIVRLSKLTYSKMVQNLWWATGYNIVALPLAAGVLVSQGIVLDPAVAAVLMSLSTIIVAFNAVLLKKRKLAA
jgi:Cu2+-exporting ATPase